MALKIINELCPNCSGALEYKGKGVLHCPFCGGQFFSEDHAHMSKELINDEADYESEVDEYEKEELTDEEIADIVFEAVSEYADPDGYGVQILESRKKKNKLSKEDKARDNFGIGDDEEVFMIFDETMFGSCKKGYVITNYALHLTAEDGELYYYPWNEFADYKLKLKDNITVKLGGIKFTLTGSNAAENTFDMLCSIQDQL